MAPAHVTRQQFLERAEQVVVAAGPGLDDREARGRVRHEHVEQPLVPPAQESFTGRGQIDHGGLAAGGYQDGLTAHTPMIAASSPREGSCHVGSRCWLLRWARWSSCWPGAVRRTGRAGPTWWRPRAPRVRTPRV